MDGVRVPLVFRFSRSTGEMTVEWGEVSRGDVAAFGQRLGDAWTAAQGSRAENPAPDREKGGCNNVTLLESAGAG